MAPFKDSYKKIKKQSKKGFRKLVDIVVKSNTTEHRIAMGAAIGLFLSIIPTFGIGMVLALLIAWFFRLNLLATYLGSLIVNPVTGPFVYLLDYKIGSLIFGTQLKIPKNVSDFTSISFESYVGGAFLSLVLSCLLYYIVYQIIKIKRKKNLDKN